VISTWIKSLAAMILGSSAVASAAPKPGDSPDEIAVWLASSVCPDYLTGEYAIADNAELKGLGFSAVPSRSASEKFGELEVVVAEFPDVGLVFGGSVDKICTVAVSGPEAHRSLAGFRKAKDAVGANFQPVPNGMKEVGGITVETYVAKVDDTTSLYAQITQSVQKLQPTVTYQLFASVN
jgi:hypothetical protein